jgi:feruloyl esterase
MHALTPLSAILPLTAALVLPHEESDCTTFAKHLPVDQHNATFLNATYYPANSFNVSNTLNKVSFCEVYTSISYGNGNNSLVAATWLPDQLQWNDRFIAVGNGGMAGVIDYAGMMNLLNDDGLGFAVSGGNAGHLASDNNNGGGEPGVYLPYLHDQEQVIAWIRDAISLFTPASKALTAAYYGKKASHSFYSGCSTGGTVVYDK